MAVAGFTTGSATAVLRPAEDEAGITVDDGSLVDETGLPCQSADPELYFAESPDDVEAAKTRCRSCPVRCECLAGALERREPWGVWGGELFLSGAVIPRKRARGRPRKAAEG